MYVLIDPSLILGGTVADQEAGEYWVVNQILARNLHSSDAGILNYTTSLMDKLERVGVSMSASGELCGRIRNPC